MLLILYLFGDIINQIFGKQKNYICKCHCVTLLLRLMFLIQTKQDDERVRLFRMKCVYSRSDVAKYRPSIPMLDVINENTSTGCPELVPSSEAFSSLYWRSRALMVMVRWRLREEWYSSVCLSIISPQLSSRVHYWLLWRRCHDIFQCLRGTVPRYTPDTYMHTHTHTHRDIHTRRHAHTVLTSHREMSA